MHVVPGTFARRSDMSDLMQADLPRVVRWINRSRASRSLRVDAEALLARHGPFPERVAHGVRMLCDSLSQGQLHPFGASYARHMVGSALKVRAAIERVFAEQPELDAVPLNRPLIVYGLQRSGTTLLHRLLAEGTHARALVFWELMQPVPPRRGPDLRRAVTSAAFHGFRRLSAENFDAIHYVRPHLPEECQFLLRLDLRSPILWTTLAAFSYAEWLMAEDMEESCRFYRRVLQFFQAQAPERRLVLKNPGHTLYARALIDALPEASFVQTHRDPLKTVPSLCKLTFTAQSAFTQNVEPERVVDTVVRMQATMAQRSVELGEGPERLLHVPYAELVADPVATARRIQERLGYGWSAEENARMRALFAQNRQHRHGRHAYSLGQYGLDPEHLRAVFSDYSERFLLS